MRENHNNQRHLKTLTGARAIRSLLDRFPRYWPEIKSLGARDEEFLELCDEYAVAQAAVEYWSESDDPAAPLHADEYRQVAVELEDEILLSLERYQESAGGSRGN